MYTYIRHCHHHDLLDHSFNSFTGDQADLETGFQQMKMRREMRAKYSVYKKWLKITLDSLPMKRERNLRLAEMELRCKLKLMKLVFDGFRSGTIGAESTKVAALERYAIELSISSFVHSICLYSVHVYILGGN